MKRSRASIQRSRAIIRVDLLLSRGPQCEGCHLTPVGSNPPRKWTDMHEVLTRARGGDATDPANILCLCRECHKFVTENEYTARELGLVRGRSAAEHQQTFKPWLS